MIKMKLSKNIRYLCKKMGLSQDDLAKKFGYKSYTTIQKWESGVSEPPFKQLTILANRQIPKNSKLIATFNKTPAKQFNSNVLAGGFNWLFCYKLTNFRTFTATNPQQLYFSSLFIFCIFSNLE